MNTTRKKPAEIPNKKYYSISEVAELLGLEQHVLRYWEAEFPKLKPKKNRAGNRQYQDKDIQVIRYIKHLLQEEMYTVQGAKKKLRDSGYRELSGQMNLLSPITGKQSVISAPPQLEVGAAQAEEASNMSQKIHNKIIDRLAVSLRKELESILLILK
jgi:DNA-binding transcriptional MerR regulator